MSNGLGKVANEKFGRLSETISNAEILRDLVKRVYLRESILACLQKYEKEDLGINWWQDVELLSVFRNMYQAGVLTLPCDAVERIRWIALICVQVCIKEGFSYGNIIYSLDYLPTSELDDRFGSGITDQIRDLRKNLTENGWGFVFGWNGKHGN